MATKEERNYRGRHRNERKVAGQASALSEEAKWDWAESLFAPSKKEDIRKAREEAEEDK